MSAYGKTGSFNINFLRSASALAVNSQKSSQKSGQKSDQIPC